MNLSPVKKGMNRNTAPYLLEGMEYLFALNTNIQDDETSVINLTNEESNVLAAKFTEGYKVIGKKNDILSQGTYFFLVNPTTEESEFGIIKNAQIEKTDILDDLEVPLEEVEQEPYQEYTVLIDKGLTLNINYPIHKIIIKNEQCGKVIAFTDNLNPPRLINLDKLSDYIITGKEVDPEKIAIFKKSLLPEIDIKPLVTGGRLRRGTYQFLIAYTNKLGEEVSEYTSITQPIPIFDKNNVILEQSELADRTNFAIKLNITHLDPSQAYYKIVVIQNTDIEGGVQFFEEGIHPISDTSVIYATEENKERTSLAKISRTFPYIKKWRGLTESNGYLIGYGLTAEKEINLQPVVSLMGSFLKWQTSVAKETLYESADDVALSRGYMRDESYPFSIRITFKNGYKTALCPFVGRPADTFQYVDGNEYHELDNVPDTKDSQSIKARNPAFSEEGRTKFWQYYNTASKEGQREVNIDYTTIQEPVTKSSLIKNVGEIPKPTSYIRIKFGNEPFTTLENFLEDNNETWANSQHPLNFLFQEFNPDNYPQHSIPDFEDCATPQHLEERDEIVVNDILNEEVKFIKREIGEYIRIALDTTANIHEVNQDGGGQRRDEAGETETARALFQATGEFFFEKIQPPTNTSREYAIPLNKVRLDYSATHNTTNIGYYNDPQARFTYNDIVTGYTSTPKSLDFTIRGADGEVLKPAFTDKVSINALWFTESFETGEDIKIIEIPKYVPQTKYGEIGSSSKILRVSIFNDCTDRFDENCNEEIKPVHVFFVDPLVGDIRELYKNELVLAGLSSDKILIAVDTPVAAVFGNVFSKQGVFVATGFNGKYAFHSRPLEYGSADVMFDEITLDKRETYRAICNFKLPLVDSYEVAPYEYGKFAYTESLETYPDNKELYDSSTLKIDLKKIPEDIKSEFKRLFIKDNPDGSYQLKENTNFTNQPIRNFRFPDNNVSPFISETKQAAFSESIIFPIGVHIDDDVVSAFLDIAVDNGLLSKEQRESVLAYEIFRGDRSLEKSIEAKGLLYDNYKVREENEDVFFSNFPFNSLGENALLHKSEEDKTFIPHPYDSEKNNSFSFISPDNQFRKLSSPTEMYVEGYQFGNSKSYFTNVEDHPKWVILGEKGYKLATTLAIAETVAEVVIQIAQATIETSKNFWFVGGLGSTGGNPVGAVVGGVATGVIAGFQILSNSIFKVARYRNEWLTTFRDLGQPENFAAFSTGMGHYNSLVSIPSMGNSLRGINTLKEAGSGRYSFRHNDSGERIVLNNQDRERSTYLYLGEDFHLEYPYEYRSFDNYDLNSNYSSRAIASEENACVKGQSREIVSNIASPYVSLKNYVPSQYGTVDSIKWLPTSYISYFDDNQDTIFGGDIFISRMTMKRKMPIFLRDAMKVADLTPFNYGFYSNIGKARFYCNYEVSEEVNLESSLFPDFKSEFNFDCTSGKRDFYVKPPSKFYLYYYGISNFLVESEINMNFRYGKKEPRGGFYPNTADIVGWTQESFVSIKEDNTYFYNFAYSENVSMVSSRTLPFTYSKEEYDCRYDSPNGAMWSLADNSEKDLSEPWLVFRPYDTYNFPASYGGLTDLKGIESGVVIGRFENQSAVFGRVDTRVEGIDPTLGIGNLFQRVQTFTETDLGYLGSKTSDMISCEYGHFFPDTDRGTIFRIDAAGKGMEEISKYSGGKPNGMDKWFRKHLPFKVKNTIVNNYDDIDTDNAYTGIGIALGWDSKNKRVFFTKKDYIPLKEMNYENGNFFAAKDEMELITDYESDGYTYLGKEGFYYKFNKPTVVVPDTATIFVFINVNDYTLSEANEIKQEVLDWSYDIANFEGEVVFISTDSNRWLGVPSQLIEGNFNDLFNIGEWNSFSTYTGQSINDEAIVLHFTDTSAYTGTEPTNEFISDYKLFKRDFKTVDYLKNIIISKDDVISGHISDILKGEGAYKDQAIQGTSPQQFLEPLGIYGISHIPMFDMDTQRALNEELGDEFIDGTILIKGDVIDVTDTDFFKDVSWTIAYQVETGSWLSYYSFKPNYYIAHNNYFQSGINNLVDKEGLWSHSMSNKSYSVFYGEKFPWTVEYPIKNEYVTKRLQSISLHTEAKRHINEHDFAYDRNITFNKAIVYNNQSNSGQLNLIPQKTLSQVTKYPITRSNSQDILITNQDFNWTFNAIYNRTMNEDGISTAWISDSNQIDKTINNDLVRFGGKKILSYLRGNYFIVRLTHDISSEHSLMFKWATNQEEVY